ncbi:MAG: hypothetical protein IJT59_05910, partial [Desulfovibrionaceae bacterium]|nr:hypothetical protein [Desulfovibrionaceae bacterium]
MKAIIANVPNLDLVQYLPPKAKNIVEFGCHDGSLGDQFKEINPKTRYVGFEHRKELLSHAKT